jgi:phosphoglycolate phosphatase-like HAD superfamily hydrolase
MKTTYSKDDLIQFQPKHSHLVAVDSDGCVFDSMEVKQKIFFHPRIIENWGLESIEPQLRATAEFVNLYSCWRGQNRFIALLQMFDLLAEHPEVDASILPDTTALRAYCESGLVLGNATLISEAERTGDPELKKVMDWSLTVNRDIEEKMDRIPPFDGVFQTLEKINETADCIIVSQTPEEALLKEWTDNGMTKYVSVIAGQELGTKTEHLQMVMDSRYAPQNVLMVGDAFGDQKAAEAVGACFYPINPGQEEDSWARLHDEALGRFFSGTFAGGYQQQLIAEFHKLLPEAPPWA